MSLRFDGLLQRQLSVADLVDDDAFAERISIRVEGDDAGDDGKLFRGGDGVAESGASPKRSTRASARSG
jgi:hypothetical protein